MKKSQKSIDKLLNKLNPNFREILLAEVIEKLEKQHCTMDLEIADIDPKHKNFLKYMKMWKKAIPPLIKHIESIEWTHRG